MLTASRDFCGCRFRFPWVVAMDDDRLRKHGFEISARAKDCEPVWRLKQFDTDGHRLDDRLYSEGAALAKCDRMDREPPPSPQPPKLKL